MVDENDGCTYTDADISKDEFAAALKSLLDKSADFCRDDSSTPRMHVFKTARGRPMYGRPKFATPDPLIEKFMVMLAYWSQRLEVAEAAGGIPILSERLTETIRLMARVSEKSAGRVLRTERINLRVDGWVVDAFRAEARAHGHRYQSMMKDALLTCAMACFNHGRGVKAGNRVLRLGRRKTA
jgi:uncharacterized protein (DUF4415 family)